MALCCVALAATSRFGMWGAVGVAYALTSYVWVANVRGIRRTLGIAIPRLTATEFAFVIVILTVLCCLLAPATRGSHCRPMASPPAAS